MDKEKAKQIIATWLVSSKGAKGQRGYIEGWFDEEDKEAFELAIEALEREIEYGQMVVDFTKGETMKSDEWKYDTTYDAESATTTDCISRADTIKAMCAECRCEDECGGECTEVAIIKGMPSMSEEDVDYCNNCPYISWGGNCISRQQAVEEIALHDCTNGEVPYFTGKEVQEILKTLPPVTPTVSTENPLGLLHPSFRYDGIEKVKKAPSVTPTKSQKFNRPVTEMLDECGIEWEYSDSPEDIKRTVELFDEAFIEAFGTRPSIAPTVSEKCIDRYAVLAELDPQSVEYKIIKDLPSLTPTERTGEWIDQSNGGAIVSAWYESHKCNKCGSYGSKAWDFCPNCGAKMGGDSE